MTWKNEISIESWNPKMPPHQIGIDVDGDIGIIDSSEYSIAISPKGAEQLRDWLNENFPAKE